MSYTIDVYRQKIRPEKNLLGFCNFVAYLPQLIAGPIERFGNLYPQITALNHNRTTYHWSGGIDRIALGLLQKLAIADGCGLIVDRLVQADQTFDFFTSWAISIGFGMQIYFDFAAYSHMAIGISWLLGVRLQENFLSPYKASNIQDFWRRWHITLSGWFRDYVYIPLGGSKQGIGRMVFNIMITFFLVGMWHGAGWNFIMWGGLHGLLLCTYRIKKLYLPGWQLPRLVAILATFLAVHFVWVPFRVSVINQTLGIWQGMLGFNGFAPGHATIFDLGFLTLVATATLLLPNASERWPGYSGWKESIALAVLALFAIFNTPEINKFIYFQF